MATSKSYRETVESVGQALELREESAVRMKSSIGTSTIPEIQHISIRAAWDGIQDHPVKVKINVKIPSSPGNRFVLFDCENNAVESASIIHIQVLEAAISDTEAQNQGHHMSELSGDTLTNSDVQQYLGSLSKNITDDQQLQIVEDDAHSQRWQMFPYPRTTTFDDDGWDQSLRLAALSESCAFSVKTRLMSDWPGHNGLEVVKKPSQSPCQEDFSPRNKTNIIQRYERRSSISAVDSMPPIALGTPTTVEDTSARKLKSKSMEPLRVSSGNLLQPGTPGWPTDTRDGSAIVGRASCKKMKKIYGKLGVPVEGTLHTFSRLPPSTALSYQFDGDTKGNGPVLSVTPSAQQFNAENLQTVSTSLAPDPAYKVSKNTPILQSPPASPRLWLRDRQWSSKYFPSSLYAPLDDGTQPISGDENGKLCLSFPDNVVPGTYETEIEASIYLSASNTNGWQRFNIPDMPFLDFAKTGIDTGSYEFLLDSVADGKPTPEVRFRPERLFDVQVQQLHRVAGKFVPSHLPCLHIRRKKAIYTIPNITCNILLCATPVLLGQAHIEFRYHARMTFDLDDSDIFAEQVDFSLKVRNTRQRASSYRLNAGVHVLALNKAYRPLLGEYDGYAIISITRNANEMYEPLSIYFSASYDLADISILTLPSVRPEHGKIHSETILLSESPPPLVMKHMPRESLGTWRESQYMKGIMRFDRVEMPPFFPEGLLDDVKVSISQLDTVPFRGLQNTQQWWVNETPEMVALNLRLRIFEVLGGGVQCQMSVDVLVGNELEVLKINSGSWDSQFALVNGLLETEETGSWRATDDGCVTLFKTPYMIFSQVVHVEFRFQQYVPEDHDADDTKGEQSQNDEIEDVEDSLPKIVGKTVLGGSVISDLEKSMIILVDTPGRIDEVQSGKSHTGRIMLPRLSPGYDLVLQYTKPTEAVDCDGRVRNTLPNLSQGDLTCDVLLGQRTVQFEDEVPETVDVTSIFICEQDNDTDSITLSDPEIITITSANLEDLTRVPSCYTGRLWRVKLIFRRAFFTIAFVFFFWALVNIFQLAFPEDHDYNPTVDGFGLDFLKISYPRAMKSVTTALDSQRPSVSGHQKEYPLHHWRKETQNDFERHKEIKMRNDGHASNDREIETVIRPLEALEAVGTRKEYERVESSQGITKKVVLRDWIDETLGWRGA